MDCLEKVVEIVKAQVAEGRGLVGFRPAFEKVFKKKDIDFAWGPAGHFIIGAVKPGDLKVVVISKEAVEVGEGDVVVGPYAVGYIG